MRQPRRRTAAVSAAGALTLAGALGVVAGSDQDGTQTVAAPALHHAAVAPGALPTSLPTGENPLPGVSRSAGSAVSRAAKGASEAAAPVRKGVRQATGDAARTVGHLAAKLPHLPGRIASGRPNILFINSDDLAPGDLRYMPNVQKLLVHQGTTFTEAISPTPLCVPARASLLTGEYAHNHRDWSISGANGGYQHFTGRDNTVAVWLHRAGYHTGLTGKFLNGYGQGAEGQHGKDPGWSDWEPTLDPYTYDFTHPKFDDNGHVESQRVYSSVAIQDRSIDMIRRAGTNKAGKKPWYLWVNYVAPHHGGPAEASDPVKGTPGWVENTRPEARDKGTFKNIQIPQTPDLFHRGPGQIDAGAPLSAAKKKSERYAYEQRIEAVQSVDRGVARTVAYLKRTGQYRRTVIIFSGDNGYATGQHNIIGKLWDFSQMQRIPMVMVGPGIPKNKKVATVVTNPDIATTIAAIAQAVPTRTQDGVDITPALARSVRTGQTLYRPVPIEAYPVDGGTESLYRGIRYGRYTYLEMTHKHDAPVLYDRRVDPYETRNLASDPRYVDVLAYLKALNAAYEYCAGVACPQTYSPTLLAPPPLPVSATARGTGVDARVSTSGGKVHAKVHAKVRARVKVKVSPGS